jgi:pimeloyl-ACP methyl ester carboxylesterase
MTDVPARVLFLHGGPGLTAELERRRFGTTLPVYWWNQPIVREDNPSPWESLVGAAIGEARRLSDEARKPVALLASSFGAQLALEIVGRIPERISSVTVSGGTCDVRMAFTQLANKIAQETGDAALAQASVAVSKSPDETALWALIQRLLSTPNLLDFYWSPGAVVQREAMKELAERGALLHLPTFEGVLRDFCRHQGGSSRCPWRGDTKILLGRYDPYVAADDALRWRELFPCGELETVEAGHFPHLELPAEVWLPR